MRFTFWAVGAPFGVLFLEALIYGMPDRHGFHGPLPGLFALWFWCGLPVTAIYWLVRLVRHAWRQGETPASSRKPGFFYTPETGWCQGGPPASSRKPGWIYPDERS